MGQGEAVRRIGTGVACALLLSMGASLLPWSGAIAQTLSAALGYSSFGYQPTTCPKDAPGAATLNGDPIKICTDGGGTVGGMYPGQPAGASTSMDLYGSGGASLVVRPTTGNVTYTAARAAFRFPFLAGQTVQPFGPGAATRTATSATANYTAGSLRISEVTTVPTNEAVQNRARITYAITNPTGATIAADVFTVGNLTGRCNGSCLLRGERGTNRALSGIGDVRGGQVNAFSASWTRSEVGGGSGVQTGTYTRIRTPGTLSDAATETGTIVLSLGGQIARATIAAGATTTFSVDYRILPARSIALSSPTTAPAAGAPYTLNARVLAEGTVAGQPLKVLLRASPAVVAAAPADAAGRAQLTFPLPATGGLERPTVFLDRNGNDALDRGEPVNQSFVYSPKPPPAPAPVPPAPVVPADVTAPAVRSLTVKRTTLTRAASRGVAVRFTVDGAAKLVVGLRVDAKTAKRLKLGKRALTVATKSTSASKARTVDVQLRFGKKARSALRRARSVTFTLRVRATDAVGNARTVSKRVVLRRAAAKQRKR